jgi:hypothetical protein
MNEFEELERRVKALEDLAQRVTQAFYAPPTKPTAPQAQPPNNLSMPEAIEHLTGVTFENGFYLIHPKHFLPSADFNIVNDWVKQQHGEYVKATSNVQGHWKLKT